MRSGRHGGVEKTMYVCLCKAVTDGQIRSAVATGMTSMRELRECLGVASDCRGCTRSCRQAFEHARSLVQLQSTKGCP